MKPVLFWMSIEASGDSASSDQLLSLSFRTEHRDFPSDIFLNYVKLKHNQIPNLNHLSLHEINPWSNPFKEGLSENQLINEVISFAKKYTQQNVKPLIICKTQNEVLFLINTFNRCGYNFNHYFNKAIWDCGVNLKQLVPSLAFTSFKQVLETLELPKCASEPLAFMQVTKWVYEQLSGSPWDTLSTELEISAFNDYAVISNSLNSGIREREITILEDLPAHQKIIAVDKLTQKVISFNYATILSNKTCPTNEKPTFSPEIYAAWSIEKEKNHNPLNQRWTKVVELEQAISYHPNPEVAMEELKPTLSAYKPAEIKQLFKDANEYSRSLGKRSWFKLNTKINYLQIHDLQVFLNPEGTYQIDKEVFESKEALLAKYPQLVSVPTVDSFINHEHPRVILQRLKNSSQDFENILKPFFEKVILANIPQPMQNLSVVHQEMTSIIPDLKTESSVPVSYIHGHFFNTLTKQIEPAKYKVECAISEVLKVYASKLLVELKDKQVVFIEFLPSHLCFLNTQEQPLAWETNGIRQQMGTGDSWDINEKYIVTQKIKASLEIDTQTFLAKIKAKRDYQASASEEVFKNLSDTLSFFSKKVSPELSSEKEFETYVLESSKTDSSIQSKVCEREEKRFSEFSLTTAIDKSAVVVGSFLLIQSLDKKLKLNLAEVVSIDDKQICFIDRVIARDLRRQGYNRHQIIFLATKKISLSKVLNFYSL